MNTPTVRLSRRDIDQIEQHIQPGRCKCCGHKIITWSPRKIVQAARAFTLENGRVPGAPDWKVGTADHPAQTSVCNMFGSWNRMLAAAGLEERSRFERPAIWTREMVRDALLDHLAAHGRWPKWRDWCTGKPGGRDSLTRPSSFTVRKLFGSWSAAIAFASGETDPSLPGNGHLKDSPVVAPVELPPLLLVADGGAAGEHSCNAMEHASSKEAEAA